MWKSPCHNFKVTVMQKKQHFKKYKDLNYRVISLLCEYQKQAKKEMIRLL